MNEPLKCPYCAKDFVSRTLIDGDDSSLPCFSFPCEFELNYCLHCHNIIFLVHTFDNKVDTYFPKNQYRLLDAELKTISPKFCDIYSQCVEAQENNLTYLVGTGLRKALEHLITDYLVAIQNEDITKLLTISLNSRINMLDKTLYIDALCHLIRIFGNDKTHYEDKNAAEITEMFSLIESTCVLMVSRYKSILANKRLSALIKP